ncbi:hypothetical protein DCE79_01330 [Lysinibacillus sp. 2017]|uniref:hypothetical protein n=1 Tax=unclassified Lysinibacillus TaxID=2636778 RepID=UPI000D527868|nr:MULTISPECIES: hypothetical protein [unclassified Lysinibacillus]AWE06118.1 hypothetical protein DCE79_01330 [Lysinibacillus sp. 2017]TGN30748.1 hypothetical protein E4L99_17350 [Lysinibacillus sp. S2017]
MAANFVAKSLERQHLKSARKYALQLVDINTVLSNIHHQIAPHIDHSKFEAATTYVNQYVAHTDIWHIKFVSNLENPEVVLMQLFHLMHILELEPMDSFKKEREIIEEQRLKFLDITLYSDVHIEKRLQKMNAYIKAY